jgi:hypothetical protein
VTFLKKKLGQVYTPISSLSELRDFNKQVRVRVRVRIKAKVRVRVRVKVGVKV